MLNILKVVLGVIALILGVRTGYKWWKVDEEGTVRVGTKGNVERATLANLCVCCIFAIAIWEVPLLLPVLVMERVGWFFGIIELVIGAFIAYKIVTSE